MNSIRIQLLKHYPEAIETFGFITKENRWNLGLDKTHYIDACVIASGGKPFKIPKYYYKKRHIPRQERILCKGVRSERKIPADKVHGFRRYDKVDYMGVKCFVKARRTSGSFVLSDIEGNNIDFRPLGGVANPSYKKITRLNRRNTTLCIKAKTITSIA